MEILQIVWETLWEDTRQVLTYIGKNYIFCILSDHNRIKLQISSHRKYRTHKNVWRLDTLLNSEWVVEEIRKRTREKAQWLRVLVTLPEDRLWVWIVCNSSSRESNALFWHLQALNECGSTCRQNTHINKIGVNKSFKEKNEEKVKFLALNKIRNIPKSMEYIF